MLDRIPNLLYNLYNEIIWTDWIGFPDLVNGMAITGRGQVRRKYRTCKILGGHTFYYAFL